MVDNLSTFSIQNDIAKRRLCQRIVIIDSIRCEVIVAHRFDDKALNIRLGFTYPVGCVDKQRIS